MDADKEYLADAETAQGQIAEIIDRFGIVGFCDICSVECEQRKRHAIATNNWAAEVFWNYYYQKFLFASVDRY